MARRPAPGRARTDRGLVGSETLPFVLLTPNFSCLVRGTVKRVTLYSVAPWVERSLQSRTAIDGRPQQFCVLSFLLI